MHTIFHDYMPLTGDISGRERGSLVSWETGITTTYGLRNAEERGVLFVDPGVEVYEGMVIGEHAKPNDISVNVCKQKHLTNVRAARADATVRLTPPRKMSLDESIEYLVKTSFLKLPRSVIAFASGFWKLRNVENKPRNRKKQLIRSNPWLVFR